MAHSVLYKPKDNLPIVNAIVKIPCELTTNAISVFQY